MGTLRGRTFLQTIIVLRMTLRQSGNSSMMIGLDVKIIRQKNKQTNKQEKKSNQM